MSDPQKFVYSFGGGKADGKADMKTLLGGKGANLAEMSVIGIPVPPGFTITTEVCAEYYENGKKLPEAVKTQVQAAIKQMESMLGAKLGDPADPLLVSVRSGAALSMPGMMNTILNLGLNDASVEGLAKKTGNPRFAYDGYRRLIDMFGSTAMGVEHEAFEHELSRLKKEKKVKLDTDLTAEDLKAWTPVRNPPLTMQMGIGRSSAGETCARDAAKPRNNALDNVAKLKAMMPSLYPKMRSEISMGPSLAIVRKCPQWVVC